MLTFAKEIICPEPAIDDETVMFDIETTGFSSRSTYLYLIGAIYRDNKKLILRQWFAENKQAEAAVLASFLKFSAGTAKYAVTIVTALIYHTLTNAADTTIFHTH